MAVELFEHYTEPQVPGNYAEAIVYGNILAGQTFTPLITHKLVRVSALLFRVGSPGIATMRIQSVTPITHLPTGDNLAIGSFDASALTDDTTGEWKDIPVTPHKLAGSGIECAMLLNAEGDNSNYVAWKYDRGFHGSYTRGAEIFSWDGDLNWFVMWGYGVDGRMFKEWGILGGHKGNIRIDQLIYQNAMGRS